MLNKKNSLIPIKSININCTQTPIIDYIKPTTPQSINQNYFNKQEYECGNSPPSTSLNTTINNKENFLLLNQKKLNNNCYNEINENNFFNINYDSLSLNLGNKINLLI